MKVEAQDLAMSYWDANNEVRIFEHINLQVDSGAMVAIVGESGVGKTTLLNLLGALELPTQGQITLGETCITKDLRQENELALFRGRNIGFIFQFFQLLPEFDAQENVALPLLLQGVKMKEALGRAKVVLERVGLGARLTHRPFMLSGGEQQRVAIARALVGKPGLVLADEPTGNLDLKTGAAISRMLLDIQKEEGITLIVVTHSMELAGHIGRTLELTFGQLQER